MTLPSGTVTFLFTDIEGSTKLWEQHPEAMRLALAQHDILLRQAIEDNNGAVFKTVGDAFCAAFHTAADALKAALDVHLALQQQPWNETGPLRVRMGLHTGIAEERDGDYFGPTLNRAARLQAIGHGQQTLLSEVTYQLSRDSLPEAVTLLDKGQHRLKDLLAPEHVWQLLHPALPAEFPPLKSLDYLPTNLPRQMTSFIGREQEVEQVKRLLSASPLLTLLGTGGAGKTRLALQVGAEVLENYKDGVWLVELAVLTEPALVTQTVAMALGLREEPGRSLLQTVQDYLRDRRLLLILDNCEHLLAACAQLAGALLKTCPHLTLLATSRAPLGIAGERSWRVPSLLTPEPTALPLEEKDVAAALMDYDACRLFVDRALLQRQEFVVTRGNAPALVSVCHRLDGIPLAIELAAARVRSLSVEEINARLDNRFRLLTGGNRMALPRQQTLRAAIDWSYDLLTSQERLLLARLSVFAGGWTLAAAEQVAVGESASGEGIEDWEVLDLLTSLVDKSLVVAEASEGTTRYRLLETVRQYAHDRLVASQENHAVRERHCDTFLALAEEVRPKLHGSEQARWLGVLEEEHDNLRQALTWCGEEVEGGEKGLRLGAALQMFWRTRGHVSEGRERLRAVLSHAGGQEPARARAEALSGAGGLAEMQGDYASARSLHQESLGIARELEDKSGIANSLSNLGNAAFYQGDYASARSLYEESLGIRRELGDKRGVAASLANLGNAALHQGDYASARSLHEESLGINRELGDKRGIAHSLGSLGGVVLQQGDYASARSLYQESLGIHRELGQKRGIAITLNNLGGVTFQQGDYVLARSLYEESLGIARQLGDKWSIAYSLDNLGEVAFHQGSYTAARSLHEESLGIRRELGDKRGIAITLNNLGGVALQQGEYASARSLYQESLGIHREVGDKRGAAYSLEAFAYLAVKADTEQRAARLWAAAAALREAIGSPLPPNDREEQESKIAMAKEALGEAAFAAAWEEGRAMTWEQAAAYALEESTG
jgi:predicted ATPase/class 3 adenylate cyclase/tetratricopeptide (TPR) repeat protein